jgi:hypothetical protein
MNSCSRTILCEAYLSIRYTFSGQFYGPESPCGLTDIQCGSKMAVLRTHKQMRLCAGNILITMCGDFIVLGAFRTESSDDMPLRVSIV